MPTAPTVSATVVTDGWVGNSRTLTISGSWATGDLMLLSVSSTWFDQYPTAVSHNTPSGWTLIATNLMSDFSDPDGWGVRTSVYYRYKQAGDTSVSWTHTGSANRSRSTMLALDAATVPASSPVDVYGGATTITAPSVTTTQANDLLLYVTGGLGSTSGAYTPPSGMTERSDGAFLSSGYYAGQETATEVIASAGSTGTRAASVSGFANGRNALNVAIKGAEAAATGKNNTFEGGSVGNTISPANSGTSGTAFDNVVIT